MEEINLLVANTALKNMMKKGWIDICAIKKILEITGGVPQREDLLLLEALHCINFQDMPPELLHEIPILLKRVLSAESLDLSCVVFQQNLRVA